MSLHNQIVDDKAIVSQAIPSKVRELIKHETIHLADSRAGKKVPKIAEKFPGFSLPNQAGETVNLADLLAKGPVVVTFYRGGWCAYCNKELSDYQELLAEITAENATLVAITPEVAEASRATIQKNALDFTVLCDANAQYAKSLGLAFSISGVLRLTYLTFDIDIEAHNGADQLDLPLAATFVIAQNGTIVSAFVDEDYSIRQDPAEIVAILKRL